MNNISAALRSMKKICERMSLPYVGRFQIGVPVSGYDDALTCLNVVPENDAYYGILYHARFGDDM